MPTFMEIIKKIEHVFFRVDWKYESDLESITTIFQNLIEVIDKKQTKHFTWLFDKAMAFSRQHKTPSNVKIKRQQMTNVIKMHFVATLKTTSSVNYSYPIFFKFVKKLVSSISIMIFHKSSLYIYSWTRQFMYSKYN